jgi:hypothetical protein
VIDEPESRVQVRETDRQSDRVHSISINPPLLPLNLSIDEPPSAAGGVWGGRRPLHREAKHLGNRGAVFISHTATEHAGDQARYATHDDG